MGDKLVASLPTGLASSSVDRNQTPSDVPRGPAVMGFIVPWGSLVVTDQNGLQHQPGGRLCWQFRVHLC